MDDLQAVSWLNGKVRLLDQTKLPEELILLEISDYRHIVASIKNLAVRGAPAIGIAAAFGVVLAIWDADELNRTDFLRNANRAIDEFKATRPTAKNLFWALDKMRHVMSKNLNRPLRQVKEAMLNEAKAILQDDIDRCRKIGEFGQELLPIRSTVLTCANLITPPSLPRLKYLATNPSNKRLSPGWERK